MYDKSQMISYYNFHRKLYGLTKNQSINYGIYNKYPYIFEDLFRVSDEVKDKFALMCDLYVDHIIFVDKLCEKRRLNLDYVVEKYTLGNELVIELCMIFNKESIFWQKYRQLYMEYFNALFIEEKIKTEGYRYRNKNEYFKVCAGKSALSKLFVYGMAVLADKVDLYDEIDEMLEYLDIYVQILDDFKDVKQDLKDMQLSYYLALAYDRNIGKANSEILNDFLDSYVYEQIDDMKIIIKKVRDCFEKHKDKINRFEDIIIEQERILQLIESRFVRSVC